MYISPWKVWPVLVLLAAAQSTEELQEAPPSEPTSEGSCSTLGAECHEHSGNQETDEVGSASVPPELAATPPSPPPLPPALPPSAPAPPAPPAPPPIPPAPPPIQAPAPIIAPAPPIRAPAFPLPLKSAKRLDMSPSDSESHGFNDREAWLLMGKRTESESERQIRLAVEDEVKMEAQHFAEVLEHQKQAIHHDAWAYFEGDLTRLKHHKLVGLQSSLVVMCFSPLLSRDEATAPGGGCRAAWLGEDWRGDPLTEDGSAPAPSMSTSKLLPPLPWGQSFPFLEQASVGNHLELARMGDDRFLICFETTPTMQVSCRMGLVANDSAVISYGALLEDSPARLVAISSAQGSQFAVCSQSVSSENSRISCRWGEVLALDGVRSATELQWAASTPLNFAFGDVR